MSKGNDPHMVLAEDIDDEVRETVDQIASCAVLVEWPSTRRLLDDFK